MGKVEECFEKKLLLRTSPSIGLARKSLKQARNFLADAEDMVKLGKERMGIIAMYNAFFHTARSLLFKDGVKERSHFCVARYIEERYVKTKILPQKFLNHLDLSRDMRHDVQYSVDEVIIGENLEEMIELCREFVSAVESFLTTSK